MEKVYDLSQVKVILNLSAEQVASAIELELLKPKCLYNDIQLFDGASLNDFTVNLERWKRRAEEIEATAKSTPSINLREFASIFNVSEERIMHLQRCGVLPIRRSNNGHFIGFTPTDVEMYQGNPIMYMDTFYTDKELARMHKIGQAKIKILVANRVLKPLLQRAGNYYFSEEESVTLHHYLLHNK